MELVLRYGVTLLSALLIVATALPLSRSHRWWIRALDFPRLQIAVLICAVLLLAALVPWVLPPGPAGWEVVAGLGLSLLYQLWRIAPFMPIWRKEMALVPAGPGDVVFLTVNVLQENTEYARVRDLIRTVNPDVLLLMEVDQRWLDAMKPALAPYATVLREPQDNYYGMVFATRLETPEAKMVLLTEDETPTLFAEMIAPGGQMFRFVGLHPKPPGPGEDTELRDAHILYAARFARKTEVPIVAMGDFNDVAWSDTSLRFKRVGGYLDPRIGRGLVSSFDANRVFLRYPIDQIYVSPEVAMVAFHRGDPVGSDHFPMIARLSFDLALARRHNRALQPMSDAEDREIEAKLAKYVERLHRGASGDVLPPDDPATASTSHRDE